MLVGGGSVGARLGRLAGRDVLRGLSVQVRVGRLGGLICRRRGYGRIDLGGVDLRHVCVRPARRRCVHLGRVHFWRVDLGRVHLWRVDLGRIRLRRVELGRIDHARLLLLRRRGRDLDLRGLRCVDLRSGCLRLRSRWLGLRCGRLDLRSRRLLGRRVHLRRRRRFLRSAWSLNRRLLLGNHLWRLGRSDDLGRRDDRDDRIIVARLGECRRDSPGERTHGNDDSRRQHSGDSSPGASLEGGTHLGIDSSGLE